MTSIEREAYKKAILMLIDHMPKKEIRAFLKLESEDSNGRHKGWLFWGILQEMVNEGSLIHPSRGVYTRRLK